MSPAALWSQAVQKIQGEIGEENAQLWLKPVEALSLDKGTLLLKVPNKFFSNFIRDNYQKKLCSAIKTLSGAEIELEYQETRAFKDLLPPSDPIPQAAPQSDFQASAFNPRYTFESFIVGDSNRFAHATAESISRHPGVQYNPFFIYGGVGLGKTHLLHAIGNALRRASPSSRVLYLTAEHFTNEFIDSIKQSKPEDFRAKYRNLDCLLIDDIQFLIAKDRSEQEFFHTFNSLFAAHKQVVISSDRSPKDMTPFEQRLISRFEWGVVADIKAPDLETRIAILRKKAELEHFHAPDDVILFLASSIKTNVRALEGSLIRLKALASVTGVALSVDRAKEILKDTLPHEDLAPVRAETIQKIVSHKYSLDVRDLKGHDRSASIAFPRQLAMYLSCIMTDMSLKEIGLAFGGKDHTTVLHARDKIKKQLEQDPYLIELVNKLQADIREAGDR